MDSYDLEKACAKSVRNFLSGNYSATFAAAEIKGLLQEFEHQEQLTWVELGGSIGEGGELIQGECNE